MLLDLNFILELAFLFIPLSICMFRMYSPMKLGCKMLPHTLEIGHSNNDEDPYTKIKSCD